MRQAEDQYFLRSPVKADSYYRRTGVDVRRVLTITLRILTALMFFSGWYGFWQCRREPQVANMNRVLMSTSVSPSSAGANEEQVQFSATGTAAHPRPRLCRSLLPIQAPGKVLI